jgi:hypothetical protein
MRHLTLAGAALATLVLAAPLSSAQADSYWGPTKVGNQCWQRQGHNSLGYWTVCKPSQTATTTRTRGGSR